MNDIRAELIRKTAELRKWNALRKRAAERIDRVLDRTAGQQLEIESMY